MGGGEAVGGEGRDGDGRRQQEVVILEEAVDRLHIVELACPHGEIVVGTVALAVPDAGDEAGVHPVLEFLQQAGVACLMHRPEEVLDLRAVGPPGRRDLLDLGPETGERRNRVGHQARHLGIDARMAEIGTPGDARAPEPLALAQQGGIVRRWGFEAVMVAGMRAGHDLQHQGRVGDRAGHRPDMAYLVRIADRQVGHAPVARLDAENAAEMARHADRAGAVGALVKRPVARRRPGARARRGRAGVQAVRPGIVRDPGKRALAHPLPSEFRGRRLAERNGAGGRQPVHAWRVLGRDGALFGVRAPLGRDVCRVGQVLDRDRHAVQGSERRARHDRSFRLLRRIACAVGRQRGESVDPRFEPLDPGQHRIDDLDRRKLARSHGGRKRGRRRETEVFFVHRSPPAPRNVGRGSLARFPCHCHGSAGPSRAVC